MPSEYDPSDFVDSDFQATRKSGYAVAQSAAASGDSSRPPTREELDARVNESQAAVAELDRAKEELKRKIAALSDIRRRQAEFETGREEMLQNLVRGLALLEESEFAARRDADQMARSIGELRDSLGKVQLINEQTWAPEAFNMELTHALTTIENARMEWNSARLKFPVLSGEKAEGSPASSGGPVEKLFSTTNTVHLCKIGLALTWPLVLLGFLIFIVLLLKS